MKIEGSVANKIAWILRDPNSWENEEFIPGKSRVFYTKAVFGKEEYIAWIKSALTGWFGLGKAGEELQKELAAYIGKRYALLTNSGSSANLLMMAALKDKSLPYHLNDGDEIIVSANSFSTTISSILHQRLVPVYIDTEIGTYNPTVEMFEKAITDRTRAILVTHTLGNPNHMDELVELCRRKNLILLEDNSDSLGSIYHRKKAGSFGLMSTFSFYPAHHITTAGEGGAIMTDSPQLLKVLRSLRDWGRDCWCSGDFLGTEGCCGKRFDWAVQTDQGPVKVDHKHLFSRQGFNIKPTEQQAAFGLEQINKVEEFNETRRRNFRELTEGLKQYEDKLILPKATPRSIPSWFAYPITIKENAGFTRSDMQKYLAKRNIDSRMMFGSNITAHPGFKNTGRISGRLDNSNFILANTFLIGCHHGLTSKMIRYVVESIGGFLRKYH